MLCFPAAEMKQCRGLAVWAAVIILISTVTVSTTSADFASHLVDGSGGGGGGGDHEDYTNPNIYDGKRNSRNTRDIGQTGGRRESAD